MLSPVLSRKLDRIRPREPGEAVAGGGDRSVVALQLLGGNASVG
jgi:hypothetical protein